MPIVLRVGLFRLDVLVELGRASRPMRNSAPDEGGEDAVARAVGKEVGLDGVPGLAGPLPARDRDGCGRRPCSRSLHEQLRSKRDVGLQAHLFIEDAVPDRVVAQRVAVEVFQVDLFDDARSRGCSSPCAPQIRMRISDEALPPSTGRSCIRATLAPCRAAAMAAHMPDRPPPTTQKSTVWVRSS